MTLNADGSYTYNPNGKFDSLAVGKTATDSFTYRDTAGDEDVAKVTITINGVNDAPVAGTVTFDDDNILEGQSTTATLTFSDVDGEAHTCTFIWGDLSPNGSVSVGASATSCSATHTYADDEAGAADDKYTVLVTVSDGSDSDSASAQVGVANVSPSLNTPVFNYNPYTGAANAAISYSDPGWLDVFGSTFSWGDGTPNTAGTVLASESTPPNATGTHIASHIYAHGCAAGSPSVTLSDDDGGSASHPYSLVIDRYIVTFRPPIQDGVRNIVKQGNVIPVKLTITDCFGNPVLGKTLSIRYVVGDVYNDDGTESVFVPDSVSGADTTGFMRQVDGMYMYNLATKTLSPNMPYTVVVKDTATNQFVGSFVIQAKK